MNEKKIQRINELARNKKTVGLTGPEKVEQANCVKSILKVTVIHFFTTSLVLKSSMKMEMM